MSVVVNDFEVVAEPPRPEEPPAPAPAGPSMTAAEVARLLRRQHERAARVAAH